MLNIIVGAAAFAVAGVVGYATQRKKNKKVVQTFLDNSGRNATKKISNQYIRRAVTSVNGGILIKDPTDMDLDELSMIKNILTSKSNAGNNEGEDIPSVGDIFDMDMLDVEDKVKSIEPDPNKQSNSIKSIQHKKKLKKSSQKNEGQQEKTEGAPADSIETNPVPDNTVYKDNANMGTLGNAIDSAMQK